MGNNNHRDFPIISLYSRQIHIYILVSLHISKITYKVLYRETMHLLRIITRYSSVDAVKGLLNYVFSEQILKPLDKRIHQIII
jgi:hypothetical protein